MTTLRVLHSPDLFGTCSARHVIGVVIVTGWNWACPSSHWDSSVQAVGSLLAILAAIWIAHRDTTNKNEADLTVALIGAVSMSQNATAMTLRLKSVKMPLELLLAHSFNADNLRAIKDELQRAPVWSVEEVARLSPLPDHCALNLT